MDANGLAQGGLAQMTLSNLHPNGSLGVPGSGFASRGKGAHIKRLSTNTIPAPNVMNGGDPPSALPRTSRSHLLAGLRTAPKTPTVSAPPPSAPPMQMHHDAAAFDQARIMPQTAVGSAFPMSLNPMNAGRQMYSLPEQVLAPPAISLMPGQEHMDPSLYAELFATNLYLAQQQQRLQQQLINVTAAAQHFQNLGINSPGGYGMMEQASLASPLSPGFGFPHGHQQHQQHFMQPSMNGQEAMMSMGGMPATPRRASPPRVERERMSPSGATSRFSTQISPPSFQDQHQRNGPFSKPVTSPTHQAPLALPPPSANAFRVGHKKATSMVSAAMNGNRDLASPSMPKTAGLPSTPMTGTFGPGQARAGEHPMRQPRGPPALEELTANPTSRPEGSKNFVTRQRRRAVHSLVRAGMERRGGRGNGSTGSAGNTTPASEIDLAFSIPSDNESDRRGSSGSRSRKPSVGSIRALASGAIGSERKNKGSQSRERDLADGGLYTAASVSSDEGMAVGGPLVEVKADADVDGDDRRQMPLLVLTSAAKRKSSVF
ncbi:MAG: hypothetical protein M1823_001239 [Watsoniomyces obsoletus]|nr:MAG: hypothetical protein M1823_001239 [Watsoniomyces obsoletus]